VKQSNERLLALIKASMDIVVAVGLLQLAPKKVTPRVTGAFGFVTSLISCYQVIALMIYNFRIQLISFESFKELRQIKNAVPNQRGVLS
jgi:Peroxisomal biogenesis factor 11 (PEX11)